MICNKIWWIKFNYVLIIKIIVLNVTIFFYYLSYKYNFVILDDLIKIVNQFPVSYCHKIFRHLLTSISHDSTPLPKNKINSLIEVVSPLRMIEIIIHNLNEIETVCAHKHERRRQNKLKQFVPFLIIERRR